MEATVVSVGKAVLHGAVSYAKSNAAKEIALQLGVERDVTFITDELQMMHSFLTTADEERDQNKVLTTWVKQIRDLAYNVEDNLMDFGLHAEKRPSCWWCVPGTLCDRRRIAEEVKDLRAKVEDVSSRNLRYRLINESSSSTPKPAAAAETYEPSVATAVEQQDKSKVNLRQLINDEEEDLRVIAVWKTGDDAGKLSAIRSVYDDPTVHPNFGFLAWVRLMNPFNPKEFLRSLVRQFYENSLDKLGKTDEGTSVGTNVLMKMEKMEQSDLVHVFNAQVTSKSYLIVIDGLSTMEEWDCVKRYFPDNKKRSRIIVSTQQAEIASLCTEKPYQESEHKQSSNDQILYLFHKKVMPTSGSGEPISDSHKVTTIENDPTFSNCEIQEEDQQPQDVGDEVSTSSAGKMFDRSRTMGLVDEVLTGRETEKSKVIELIGESEHEQGCKVISVWGMGGLGKTTLVRSVYQSQPLGGWKYAWVTALRPFNHEVVIRTIALQLLKDDEDAPGPGATATVTQKENLGTMGLTKLVGKLTQLLNKQKCLIVLDDISSNAEWDLVKNYLGSARRIIVTTREKNIAKTVFKRREEHIQA